MSQAEVFIPSDGEIAFKGNLSHGLGESYDVFRKSKPSTSRPASQSSSRFGRLSYNSFFARHNPHPGRVRHIKGLLDVPICSVNDEMYMANPRYSLQFPPDNHDQKTLKYYSGYNIPANSINVNTQSHPINTITGLQYFLGKPLNFRIFGGKSKPKKGIADVPEAWRDELKVFTDALQLGLPKPEEKKEQRKTPLTGRPKTQYSETTGRLIPPPSRAMSRGFSRQSQRREHFLNTMADQLNMEAPDIEETVMTLLCQILQTDDINAVQQWLVSAGDREKTLVMDMLRAAVETQEEYYKQPEEQQYVAPPVEKPVTGVLGDEDDPTKRIERLSLEPSSPRPRSVSSVTKLPPIGEQQPQEQEYNFGQDDLCYARPPTSDPFRPASRKASRPASRAATPKTPKRAETPKLKYTSSNETSWKQDESTVQQ